MNFSGKIIFSHTHKWDGKEIHNKKERISSGLTWHRQILQYILCSECNVVLLQHKWNDVLCFKPFADCQLNNIHTYTELRSPCLIFLLNSALIASYSTFPVTHWSSLILGTHLSSLFCFFHLLKSCFLCQILFPHYLPASFSIFRFWIKYNFLRNTSLMGQILSVLNNFWTFVPSDPPGRYFPVLWS